MKNTLFLLLWILAAGACQAPSSGDTIPVCGWDDVKSAKWITSRPRACSFMVFDYAGSGRVFRASWCDGDQAFDIEYFFKSWLLIDGGLRLYQVDERTAELDPESYPYLTAGRDVEFSCSVLILDFDGRPWRLNIEQ